MDLSVIIVSHHHDRFLPDCFRSLEKHLSNLKFEIILVDNVASPSLKTTLDTQFPNVKLLANPRPNKPRGFAKNCNEGFRASKGEYILLLNADTQVLQGDFAEFIRRMKQDPKIGAACGQLLNSDLSPQAAIRRFPTLPAILSRGFMLEKFMRPSKAQKEYLMEDEDFSVEKEIDWCLGAFMLMSRDLYEKIGMMDEESFFQYYEDIDLCYRLKKAGWKTYYFPEVKVIHDYQRDSAKKLINQQKISHLKSICSYFWKHKYLFHPGI